MSFLCDVDCRAGPSQLLCLLILVLDIITLIDRIKKSGSTTPCKMSAVENIASKLPSGSLPVQDQVLESGASATQVSTASSSFLAWDIFPELTPTQSFRPLKQICAHLNAFHSYASDAKRCVEANHYCAHISKGETTSAKPLRCWK